MQTSLFHAMNNPDECQEHHLGDALIREYPHAFAKNNADSFLASLIRDISWQQDSLRIAGKIIPVPRLQCWMGDRESRYGYSGIRLQPQPWHESVMAIRSRVEELAGVQFNSVLLNYYRDGQDSVAWHADDENELGPDPVIASVSFGAVRPFLLKSKAKETGRKYRLNLQHGSLLIMGKGLQINWLHQLPKVKHLNQSRINLTFRQIL